MIMDYEDLAKQQKFHRYDDRNDIDDDFWDCYDDRNDIDDDFWDCINQLNNNKIIEIYEFIATLINIRKLELTLPFECVFKKKQGIEKLSSTSLEN